MLYKILTNFWFIQFIGVIALAFSILAFQNKKRNKILLLQSLSAGVFIFHYWLLLAYTGAILNFIIIFRNLVFNQRGNKNWANNPAWLYFFIFLAALALLLSWHGWISILPVIGVAIGTYAVWNNKPSSIRFFMFLTAFAWIPYTIVVHSYSGLATGIISATFILIGIFRLDREELKKSSMDIIPGGKRQE